MMLIITCLVVYWLVAGIYMAVVLANTEGKLSIAGAVGCLMFGGIVAPIVAPIAIINEVFIRLGKIIIWRRKS